MAASKLNREDAQEWLESLQQVGEGWYRQVALAVRAGAHKALGMERREFAQQIGQRLIDPREAIVELHREGHNEQAIADVLGIGDKTVTRALVEAGVRELPPWMETEFVVDDAPDEKSAVADEHVAELVGQLEDLEASLEGQKKRAREAAAKWREESADLKRQIILLERAAEEEDEKLDAKAQVRRRNELEAELSELRRRTLSKFADGIADGIVASIENATEQLGKLIRDDILTASMAQRIDNAVQELVNQSRLAELAGREA